MAQPVTYHFIHEILDAHLVQNTVGINEQDEQIVVAFQIFSIYFINQSEGRLLTFSLSSMGESRYRYPCLLIGHIDTLGVTI